MDPERKGRYRVTVKAGSGAGPTGLAGGKSDPGVESVVIHKNVNKIPTATVTIYDGSPALRDFEISAEDKFAPGEEIEILCGYGDDSEHTVFKGIIVKQRLKHRTGRYNVLILECKDVAVRMTVGRKNKYFNDGADTITDDKIIKEIVGEYSDIKLDVETTSVEHHKMIQNYVTDWDFIVSRAEANAMVVIPNDGELKIARPGTTSTSIHNFSFGDNLFDFNLEVDARTQLKEVAGRSWDPSLMGTTPSDAVVESSTKNGDVSADAKEHKDSFKSKDLAKVIDLEKYQLQSSSTLSENEIAAWTESKMLKSRLSRIRGDLKLVGNHDLKPGDLINLKEVASKFNGDAYVSGVTHEMGDGEWYTTVEIGLPFEWYTEDTDNVIDTPAAGLVASIQGVHIGFVKAIFEDGNANAGDRLLVVIPTIDPDGAGIWARLCRPDAGLAADGSSRGIHTCYSEGDEVLVAFLNNDPRDPVVVGFLHNESAKTPEEFGLTADNFVTGIVTKEKLQVLFDDEKKVITVQTPGEQKIIINDEEGSISLIKDDKNSVIINDDGVTITTDQKFIVEADGGIEMGTKKAFEVAAKGDVAIEGTNVEAAAQANMKLEASAQLEAKGALIKLN